MIQNLNPSNVHHNFSTKLYSFFLNIEEIVVEFCFSFPNIAPEIP